MPLKLEMKREMTGRSERVKSISLHPEHSWLLCGLYSGKARVWDYQTQQIIKDIQASNDPVRAAIFIPRKSWIVTGSDDFKVNVFNYNTLDKVTAFEAHSDFIRSIVCHPTQSCIITAGDDLVARVWSWSQGWQCIQTLRAHTHYLMQVAISPWDNTSIATASLDHTIKMWRLGCESPSFTLEGHEGGVNCVQFSLQKDSPHLVSGGEDGTVRVWDHHTKTQIRLIEGHMNGVTAVMFHSRLPILISGSEDGTLKIWHKSTYRLESSVNHGLERLWTMACKGSNHIALGYDYGSIVLKIGSEVPAISMDSNRGKIVWSDQSTVLAANVNKITQDLADGERLPILGKELGMVELHPQYISHGPPRSSLLAVVGGGEYLLLTAATLTHRTFGQAEQLVWSYQHNNRYALRQENGKVVVCDQFKEISSIQTDFPAEAIYGGHMLGISTRNAYFGFYDWDTMKLVRRIEIEPTNVFWSKNGEMVCIATDSGFFILKNVYSPQDAFESNEKNKEGNNEESNPFEVLFEVNDCVVSGLWIEDCFVYTDATLRLNYFICGDTAVMAHLDKKTYLLGYMVKQNRLYLSDASLDVISFKLPSVVLDYKTAIVRGDLETADALASRIPTDQKTKMAHYLCKQGLTRRAFEMTLDPDHAFSLSLELRDWSSARRLCEERGAQLWGRLGEAALQDGELALAKEAFSKAGRLEALMTVAVAAGDETLLGSIFNEDDSKDNLNGKFMVKFLTGDLDGCLNLLVDSGNLPMAGFFARSYLPKRVSEIVNKWKSQITNEKLAQQLADPAIYDNLFPEISEE